MDTLNLLIKDIKINSLDDLFNLSFNQVKDIIYFPGILSILSEQYPFIWKPGDSNPQAKCIHSDSSCGLVPIIKLFKTSGPIGTNLYKVNKNTNNLYTFYTGTQTNNFSTAKASSNTEMEGVHNLMSFLAQAKAESTGDGVCDEGPAIWAPYFETEQIAKDYQTNPDLVRNQQKYPLSGGACGQAGRHYVKSELSTPEEVIKNMPSSFKNSIPDLSNYICNYTDTFKKVFYAEENNGWAGYDNNAVARIGKEKTPRLFSGPSSDLSQELINKNILLNNTGIIDICYSNYMPIYNVSKVYKPLLDNSNLYYANGGSVIPKITVKNNVNGCAYWGRGSIQTTGLINYSVANILLADIAWDGQSNLLCNNPQIICTKGWSEHMSDEKTKLKYDIQWIAGLLYWMTNVQTRPLHDLINAYNHYIKDKNPSEFINKVQKSLEFINDTIKPIEKYNYINFINDFTTYYSRLHDSEKVTTNLKLMNYLYILSDMGTLGVNGSIAGGLPDTTRGRRNILISNYISINLLSNPPQMVTYDDAVAVQKDNKAKVNSWCKYFKQAASINFKDPPNTNNTKNYKVCRTNNPCKDPSGITFSSFKGQSSIFCGKDDMDISINSTSSWPNPNAATIMCIVPNDTDCSICYYPHNLLGISNENSNLCTKLITKIIINKKEHIFNNPVSLQCLYKNSYIDTSNIIVKLNTNDNYELYINNKWVKNSNENNLLYNIPKGPASATFERKLYN
tara:strand:+ start:6448 stop:8649 length:2202 start_codon:yes stop_codon:yes gene_type:complete